VLAWIGHECRLRDVRLASSKEAKPSITIRDIEGLECTVIGMLSLDIPWISLGLLGSFITAITTGTTEGLGLRTRLRYFCKFDFQCLARHSAADFMGSLELLLSFLQV
jgi:hypothetical protein